MNWSNRCFISHLPRDRLFALRVVYRYTLVKPQGQPGAIFVSTAAEGHKDTPIPRPVAPPELGRVLALSQIGGLHHRYEFSENVPPHTSVT
jgi:hypothetical protein